MADDPKTSDAETVRMMPPLDGQPQDGMDRAEELTQAQYQIEPDPTDVAEAEAELLVPVVEQE